MQNETNIIAGKNIEKLMSDQNMTVKELAEKSGIPLNRLKVIIEGKYLRSKTSELIKLAKTLNASSDYILGINH